MFFCRNCGKELTGTPENCMNCGVKPITGTSFCPWCGAPTTPLDEICTNCGVQLAKAIEEKTWKPTAAGVLSIICGVGQVIGGMVFAVGSSFLARFTEMEFIGGVIERFSGSYTLIGILLIVLGVIAIVGGICALRRRIWGLALAGSICALPTGLILGILAVIFVISGKREFECGARMKKEPAEGVSPKTKEPAEAISPKSRLVPTIIAVRIRAFVDFIFAVIGRMKGKGGRPIKKRRRVVPAEGISPKLRLATTLLAFFLGIFGAHRFYVGKNETASIMLSFSILGLTILGLAIIAQLNGTWFFWGLSFIIAVWIWAFVDFIFAVIGRMEDNEGRLIQKWWLVMPARAQTYYYIKYTTSALRVIAWIILVLGCIGSLVWGIITGGFGGGFRIVLGIIGSFLAWLLLLAASELFKLFLDVKANTRSTAESIAKD
jgi:hypothetical protein